MLLPFFFFFGFAKFDSYDFDSESLPTDDLFDFAAPFDSLDFYLDFGRFLGLSPKLLGDLRSIILWSLRSSYGFLSLRLLS